MKRKTFIRSSATSVAALSLPRRVSAADPVRVGILPIDSSMEANYAEKIGYASQAKIDFSIQQITSGAAVMSAIVGGSIDTGVINMFSILTARDKGIPVVLLAGSALYSSKFPTAALVVSADSPIHGGADFAGKTIAVDALSSISQLSAMAWIDKNGGNSKLVRFVEIPIPDMQAALSTHRVDAASMPQPFASRAVSASGRLVCNVYDGIAPLWLQNAWAASPAWTAANSDVARRFKSLIYRTAAWANTHEDESATILSQVSKVDLSIIRATPRVHYAEQDSTKLLDPVIDVALRYGLIKKRPDALDLFAPEVRR